MTASNWYYKFDSLNCNKQYWVTYNNSTSYNPFTSQYEYSTQQSNAETITIPQSSFVRKNQSLDNNFWLIDRKLPNSEPQCGNQKLEKWEICESNADCWNINRVCSNCQCITKIDLTIDTSSLQENKNTWEMIITKEQPIPLPKTIHTMWVQDKEYLQEIKDQSLFYTPRSSKILLDTPYILPKQNIVIHNAQEAKDYLFETILPAYPEYKNQSIISIPSVWIHAPINAFWDTEFGHLLRSWDHEAFINASKSIQSTILINNVIEAHSSRLKSWNTKNYFLPLVLTNVGDDVSIYMYDNIHWTHTWMPFTIVASDNTVNIKNERIISELYAPDQQDSIFLMTCGIVNTNQRIIKTLKPKSIDWFTPYASLRSNITSSNKNTLNAFIASKKEERINKNILSDLWISLDKIEQKEGISMLQKNWISYIRYQLADSF